MKFEKYLSSLDVDELKALYTDIVNSNSSLLNKIKREIALSDKFYSKSCAVCGNPLVSVKEPLVLEFGPRDLRKEAAFCGADCLQYFIKHMLILKEAPLKKVKKRSKKKKKGFFEALFSL